MTRSQKRLLSLLIVLPVLIVASAIVYMLAMAGLEGEQRTFLQSLAFAAETLSTTGYGAVTPIPRADAVRAALAAVPTAAG